MLDRAWASILLAIAVGLGITANATADGVQFTSGANRTTLIELFTSEGCSSCPPADRWLSELRTDGRLWRDFIPVAYHVDYWDYIGWRDRFANRDYSDRQRRYAREGGVNTVYTPGMFKNGKEWRGWWRGEGPEKTLAPAGRLALNVDGERVSVGYRVEGASKPKELLVHVALLGMDLESRITAGENDGRTLRHDFVVLGVESAPLKGAGNRLAAELSLPKTSEPTPRQAVVAWVSASNRQAPLQSVGGYLEAD